MAERHESPLEIALKGAVAGLVGTAVITAGLKAEPMVMEELGVKMGGGEEPTEKLAAKVAAGVVEEPLDDEQKKAAGQAIHWTYGAAWGVLYSIVQSSLKLPHLIHGPVLGGLVSLSAMTLVPGMKLTPPPDKQPDEHKAYMTGLHLIYGLVVALVFHLLSPSSKREK